MSKAGIIFLTLLALTMPLLTACSDDDEAPVIPATAADAKEQPTSQSARLVDPDEPPQNPYLADSIWSTTHRDSYCHGSSPMQGRARPPLEK